MLFNMFGNVYTVRFCFVALWPREAILSNEQSDTFVRRITGALVCAGEPSIPVVITPEIINFET